MVATARKADRRWAGIACPGIRDGRAPGGVFPDDDPFVRHARNEQRGLIVGLLAHMKDQRHIIQIQRRAGRWRGRVRQLKGIAPVFVVADEDID